MKPADLNWDKIRTGETFQSLISSLILKDDPNALVFDRPGKDSGIDIKSSDNSTVIQAKFVKSQKFTSVLTSAKKEFKQICKYRDSINDNYEFWKDVTKWHLYTNAKLNPKDFSKWQKEISPLFKGLGFNEVKIFHEHHVHELLITSPDILKAYFENENRVFLTAPEKSAIYKNEKFYIETPLLGRDEKVNELHTYLNDTNNQILLLIGSPGTGKTRLGIEASSIANFNYKYDVYWANIASMSFSNRWFDLLLPSRKTLLIFDNPDNVTLIKALFEQLPISRLKNWKSIIIIRNDNSNFLDSIRKQLYGNEFRELFLDNLDEKRGIELLRLLLKNIEFKGPTDEYELDKWINKTAKRCEYNPLLLCMAAEHLKNNRDLINDVMSGTGTAPYYFENSIDNIASNRPSSNTTHEWDFKYLINWLSLLLPTSSNENNQLYDELVKIVGVNRKYIISSIKYLRKNNFIVEYGNYLFIKPDLLRDHILFNWLKEEDNRSEILSILRNNLNNSLGEHIIKQVSRFELFWINQKAFDFLGSLTQELINQLKDGSLIDQYNILKLSKYLCIARPSEIVRISQTIRNNPKPAIEENFSFLNQNNLVPDIPWHIFNIAIFVFNETDAIQIINELIQLSILEEESLGNGNNFYYNDGKRSLQLVTRLFHGEGKHYDYESIILSWALDSLSNINQLNAFELNVLFKLCKSMIHIERRHDDYANYTISWYTYYILLDNQHGKNWQSLYKGIWKVIKNNKISNELRSTTWDLISEIQRQLNIATDTRKDRGIKNAKEKSKWSEYAIDNLKLTYKHLFSNKVNLIEAKNIRKIWDWNLRFDERNDYKALAQKCEDIYLSNPKIQLMHSLYSGSYENIDKTYKSIVKKIETESYSLDDFITDSIYFLNSNEPEHRISQLGSYFFAHSKNKNNATRVIDSLLAKLKPNENIKRNLILSFYLEKITNVRKKNRTKFNSAYFEVHSKLISHNHTEPCKHFFYLFYGRYFYNAYGLPTQEDLDIAIKHFDDFNLCDDDLYAFITIFASMFEVDFKKVKHSIANVWKLSHPKISAKLFEGIIKGIEDRLLFKKEFPVSIPNEFFNWLISQIHNVENIDSISSLFDCHIDEIRKVCNDEIGLSWYLDFLLIRLNKKEAPWKTFMSSSSNRGIAKLITPLSTTNIDSIIKEKINKLLMLYENKSEIRYYLPKLLVSIDPSGILIPELVIDKLQLKSKTVSTKKQKDHITKWCWFASYYQYNSDAWRSITTETLKTAGKKAIDFDLIMDYLDTEKNQSLTGIAGEFNPRWDARVKTWEKQLAVETNTNISLFCNWKLRRVKQERDQAWERFQLSKHYDD